MFLTAAAELAPGQWVDIALTRTVGMKGIILLIYVSGLMFVMRHFAGTFAHKLSPIGLLWVSCLLASVGLLLLSVANSPVTGLLAAIALPNFIKARESSQKNACIENLKKMDGAKHMWAIEKK